MKYKDFFQRALCALAILLACPIVTPAQSGQAELTGYVRDVSGASVHRATVRAVDVETQLSTETVTGGGGVFTIASLEPGFYRVEVEADGFRRLVRDGIRLVTGERSRVEFTLEAGGLTESVTVTADVPLLRSESGNLSHPVTNEKIVGLPLNGRNFVQLVALVPGVALPPASAFPRINGGRPRTNEYLFDGISVLQPEPGQVAFTPVIDAIQEFNVQTNAPPAEFGRTNGGVVNLTTKSGSNELHGSVFEFLRNEALNARNLFAPGTATSPDKPVFRRNQFGFVLGGPIVRDRTFFFADYQGTRQLIGRVRTSTVPTRLQRDGIFTEAVAGVVPQIFDPATTAPRPGGGFTRNPFPGNRIPVSRFDPVALLLLDRYPLPNLPGTANNYRRVGNERTTQDQFDVRIDHRFSDFDQIFGRYSHFRDDTVPVTPLPEGSGLISTGALGPTVTTGNSLASSWVHAFGPRTTNELRFGYTRRSIDRSALLLGSPASEALGLPGIPSDSAFDEELPTFLVDGLQQLGPPANTNSRFRTDVTQIVDTLFLQRGRHSIKAGIDFRWERLDVIQPPSPAGSFRFSALFTDQPGVSGTGLALASFLLGQVQTFSIDLQEDVLRPRAHIQEYLVQDDWKISDRVTVNLGLRYTLNFPSTERNDQSAVFNLDSRQLEYAGQGAPRAARELHKNNFGPRLGVAWRIGDDTVLRSGYGLVWIEMAGITTPFTTPFFPFIQSVSQRTLDNVNPAFVLANGPSVSPIPSSPDAGLGQGVFSVDRDLGSGYAQQWNVAVQHEIVPGLAFEAAYAGSKITHVGIPDTNINQLTAEQLRLGPALLQRVPNPYFGLVPRSSSLGDPTISVAQLLKPYPQFTTVSLYRNNVGNTNYNAVQLKLERRFSDGWSFLVSYTRSKLIDEASSVFDASILTGPVANFPVADSHNRRLERDVSSGDIPNVFVASFTWALPFGKGRRFEPGGIAGLLAGGWELTGIGTMQSGLPLAVTQVTNFNSFAGFGTQRPDRIGDPELPGSIRSTSRWFDTTAFRIAPVFTLGSSSRNPVRGPAYRNADIAILKRTALTERLDLEFRTEIFNLTNTPPLGNPATVAGAPGFGAITTAGDPRVIQFGAKLLF